MLGSLLLTVSTTVSNVPTINEEMDSKLTFTANTMQVVEELTGKELNLNVPVFAPLSDLTHLRLTSLYGWREHPILHTRLFHYGMDMVSSDRKVVATGYGVVRRTRRSRFGYGNYIIIDHLNGFSTRYAHLAKMLVHVGDTVQPKQLIAYYGTSGLSTGPHLHYEVAYNGMYLDPSFISGHKYSYLAYLKNSKDLLVTGYTKSIENGKDRDNNKEVRPQYYLAFQRKNRIKNHRTRR